MKPRRLRQIVLVLLACLALPAVGVDTSAMGALHTDVNTASRADLESVKGIGPVLAASIIEGRTQGPYKDWRNLVGRVPGLGDKSARRLSKQGLTVDGKDDSGIVEPASNGVPPRPPQPPPVR